MDILRSLSRQYGNGPCEVEGGTILKTASQKPLTVSELLDGQIAYHESKIADLKEAKAAISPDVEKALNALAKIQ